MPGFEARLAHREPPGPSIELGIERVGRLRNVREQQLDHHLLAGHRPRAVGGHLHSVCGVAAARRREHPLALDLHHAGAAVAIRPHAFFVAKMRNRDAVASCCFDEALVGAAGNGPAVQRELDRLRRRGGLLIGCFYGHRSPFYLISCGKYLMTESAGFGAACPSPQIDASAIACDSSFSSGWSQVGRSMSLSALTVPTRQGVHWPQDSSEKNFIRLRAASDALS